QQADVRQTVFGGWRVDGRVAAEPRAQLDPNHRSALRQIPGRGCRRVRAAADLRRRALAPAQVIAHIVGAALLTQPEERAMSHRPDYRTAPVPASSHPLRMGGAATGAASFLPAMVQDTVQMADSPYDTQGS